MGKYKRNISKEQKEKLIEKLDKIIETVVEDVEPVEEPTAETPIEEPEKKTADQSELEPEEKDNEVVANQSDEDKTDDETEERADEVIEEPIEPTETITEETPTETEEIKEQIIEGYGIVFNSMSKDLGGFVEVILPEAVTQETINNSDIHVLYQHNEFNLLPLARSNKGEGSLSIEIDSIGVKYSFNCLNDEVYQLIKRGDMDKSSFAFSVSEENEEWVKDDEHNYIRYIKKIDKLYDFSIVLMPAYEATSVYARNLDTKKVDETYYEPYQTIINNLIQIK